MNFIQKGRAGKIKERIVYSIQRYWGWTNRATCDNGCDGAFIYVNEVEWLLCNIGSLTCGGLKFIFIISIFQTFP